jgi:phosphoglycerol transferase MdoB-like AlkP superfamily enzyme
LFNHLSYTELSAIFLGGVKFDIVAILYINSLFIVLQALPFSFKYHKIYQDCSKWLFIVSNSIGFMANFADFAYYKYTLKRTTASVFSQFANEQNKLKLTGDFILDYWFLLLCLIAFIYFFIKIYGAVKIRKAPQFTWKIYIGQLLVLGLIAGLSVVGMRGGWRHSTRPITMSNAGDFVKAPSDMALVLNTPFTIMKTLKASNLKLVNYYPTATLDSLYNPIHQPSATAPFRKLNVVFLIIESLGKEHIGALNKDINQGKYRGYTPFIDSLVANSFTSSSTYANGRKSIDALPSIISGIPSIKEPFVLSKYSGNRTESIAKLLSDKGYETAFFHGAPNGSMGFSAYTNLAGINHYFGKTEYNNDDDFDGIWGIWDEPFMQYMAKTLDTFKQPFFSAFFSVSSHHPFKVPEKYKGKFPKGPLPVQEPMGYTDMSIRKFFATASKMAWFKNTLFVLVADHATVSYFPEYQNVNGSFSIPILFYYPGGELKGKTDKIIQQIDIMPTVLNYVHYDKPYFAFGFDAMNTKRDNFVVNNNDGSFSFFQGDYLLLSDGEKAQGLFNIKKDRLMKNNFVNQSPEIQAKMMKYLRAFIQQYNNRMINDQLTAK